MEAVTGADLSFVNLGITIEHLPNSITVFGFRIAFYGIIIGLGMLAGMAIACSDARRRGQDPDIYPRPLSGLPATRTIYRDGGSVNFSLFR